MNTGHWARCLGVAVLMSISLAGCTLYFGPNDDDYQPEPPCDDPSQCTWECWSDDNCAAGCYCEDSNRADGLPGYCVETGYCSVDSDCEEGMVCDAGTCKPEDRGCQWDADCPPGNICDVYTGVCYPDGQWTCTSDDQCAAGCYCDEQTGYCEETSYCTADNQCPQGQYCDEARATCMPGEDPNAPSCAGDVICTTVAPNCPSGQVPLIANGCYTGACLDIDSCTAAPVCQNINDEAHCLGRADCTAVYTGRNCTDPNGAACTSGSMNCECETFNFAECEADQ